MSIVPSRNLCDVCHAAVSHRPFTFAFYITIYITSCTIPISTVFLQQPTTLVADKVVELDFSLPSYSDSVKGGDISKSKLSAPSFNPFGDFEPSKVGDDLFGKSSSSSVDEPAVAVQEPKVSKAEQKAAAEAKKAEEKAAAEAKKAEKEARLKAEREKQKAALERSKQVEAESAAETPSFKAPEMPEFKAPDFKLPDTSGFKAPEMPDFKAPDLSGFKAPDMPKFDMPDTSAFKAPDMPKFEMPDTSGFKAPDMPKFDTSKLPKFDVPKIDLPKNDYIDLDQLPKFDAPKVSLPSNLPSFPSFGGSDSSKDSVILAPQDVRDERARAARQVYLEYDASAKDIEAQAREARNLANEKKKLANAAKDEACQTRPGGKLLCLRNPFTAGF